MSRMIFAAFAVTTFLVSCSSLKPISTTTNGKQASAQSNSDNKKEVKFLDISSTDDAGLEAKEAKKEVHTSGTQYAKSDDIVSRNNKPVEIERASALQIKYALLMNTEIERIQNISLYQNIDDWYGTRYQLGGTTKNGIDCSAFVQTIFLSAFAVTLPRMAKDQYKVTRRISRTELKEGDLLFFNTRGGVSHVGIYLQNNKFVHASVSGVMISDMFEPYYVKHFISAGRVTSMNNSASVSLKP
ncbi:MAG TPA: NlpC/P60 family protein [Chitinophagaceae bacterium]|jgi:NlpC/P60 family protein|nr:NlpC/P60 family protein [Chitinophagaceae bacterium]